jgi:hypothetical protein
MTMSRKTRKQLVNKPTENYQIWLRYEECQSWERTLRREWCSQAFQLAVPGSRGEDFNSL